jgi:very-short-patch-repair endonuclease
MDRLPYDKRLKARSQALRKELTPAERFLWSKIRLNQLKGSRFYRQKPIGTFIADFYCPKANLVIEVDGRHHLKSAKTVYDKERDLYITENHQRVIRFTNTEVLSNIQEVIVKIEEVLDTKPE